MDTWLITRYLLARFQQLKEHLRGFRTAKPVSSALTNRNQWLRHGQEMGWISAPNCYWHDTIPLSDEEEAILDEEDELCVLVVRIYE